MIDDAELTELVRDTLTAEVADVAADAERLLAGILSPSRRRRARQPGRVLAFVLPAATVAVVLAVLVAAGTIGGRASRTTAAPTTRPHLQTRRRSHGPVLISPAAPAPTLAQLIQHFAVFRRPQTAADRSWHEPDGGVVNIRQLPRYTRLIARLARGGRVFLTVDSLAAGGSAIQPTSSGVMTLWFVFPPGTHSIRASAIPYDSNVASFTIMPVAQDGLWVSMIPDGVATVRWTFRCIDTTATCRTPHRGVTVPAAAYKNVVLLRGTEVPQCSGDACQPIAVEWRSAGGTVMRHWDMRELDSGNLEPFPLGQAGR